MTSETLHIDPVARFSTRVEDYIASRPHYPKQIFELLVESFALDRETVLADIGVGTGLLSEPFLRLGMTVWGVEPNAEMRAAGTRLLAAYPKFHPVNGRAEATDLPEASVHGIIAGQAFHWFDPVAAREEFERILKPGGWVALVWNRRRLTGSVFLEEYERFLRTHGTDYQKVDHTRISASEVRQFFGHDSVKIRSFDNEQRFDWEGLKQRVLSCSYIPQEGHPGYEPMLEALRELFEAHAADDTVRFEYDSVIYFGRLQPAALEFGDL